MQTPNPTAARAGSEMEQALTKVLNEKSALQAENAALRAALENILSDLEDIYDKSRAALAKRGAIVSAAIQRFPIGTQFKPRGKDYVCTVTDYWVTRNLAGEVVQSRYVATHEFCGQTVTNCDIVDPTIARGIIAKTDREGSK
jgi:hypothetical protein